MLLNIFWPDSFLMFLICKDVYLMGVHVYPNDDLLVEVMKKACTHFTGITIEEWLYTREYCYGGKASKSGRENPYAPGSV